MIGTAQVDQGALDLQTGPNSCECTFSCPNLCPSLYTTC